MTDYCDSIKEAADLVHEARLRVSGGPHQPWHFLLNVEAHLTKQLTAQFEPTWAALRSEEQP